MNVHFVFTVSNVGCETYTMHLSNGVLGTNLGILVLVVEDWEAARLFVNAGRVLKFS